MTKPNHVCDVLYLGIRKCILGYKVLLGVRQFVWGYEMLLAIRQFIWGMAMYMGGTAIYIAVLQCIWGVLQFIWAHDNLYDNLLGAGQFMWGLRHHIWDKHFLWLLSTTLAMPSFNIFHYSPYLISSVYVLNTFSPG
jgi:hypothetical protein